MVAKRKNNRREKMSSKGWSTSPLSVRVEELVSARIFFSHCPVVQAIFLRLCMHFFYIAIRVA